MAKICKVRINGELVSANPGDLLLDVALVNGIELPYDCRSGYCGTCQVRVISGRCIAPTGNPDFVHACQTRLISDLQVVAEKVPEISAIFGNIVDLVDIAPDVVEVSVESEQPLDYIPGQYLSMQFRGFPARHYSPTAPLDWPNSPNLIYFQVRRFSKGRVSSALGRKIKRGHRVKMTGPFGAAYFRSNDARRLVLISSGTGFAPIWAIAEAAIREKPKRDLILIAGARDLDSIYMIPALCRLALFPCVTIVPTTLRRQSITSAVRHGSPINYLPILSKNDVVYAAGAPALVQAVVRIAQAGGVSYFTDSFLPAEGNSDGRAFLSRLSNWIAPAQQGPPPLSIYVGRQTSV
jgi:3-phenylpropionate/trans-cinnamate dioxygenase ferredoxin reductase subunit